MRIFLKLGITALIAIVGVPSGAFAQTSLSNTDIAAQCAAEGNEASVPAGTCAGLVNAKIDSLSGLSADARDAQISDLVIALSEVAQQDCTRTPPLISPVILNAIDIARDAASGQVLIQQISAIGASLQSCDNIATASITPFGGGSGTSISTFGSSQASPN